MNRGHSEDQENEEEFSKNLQTKLAELESKLSEN